MDLNLHHLHLTVHPPPPLLLLSVAHQSVLFLCDQPAASVPRMVQLKRPALIFHARQLLVQSPLCLEACKSPDTGNARCHSDGWSWSWEKWGPTSGWGEEAGGRTGWAGGTLSLVCPHFHSASEQVDSAQINFWGPPLWNALLRTSGAAAHTLSYRGMTPHLKYIFRCTKTYQYSDITQWQNTCQHTTTVLEAKNSFCIRLETESTLFK